MMNFGQMFQNFSYEDLQWLLPVLAGLVIIVGALVVALFRGMNAGVLVALLLGGVMSLSPTLLGRLEQNALAAVSPLPAEVARGAAELALLNSEVVTDLSAVMGTLRNAIAGLAPLLSAGADISADPEAAALFAQSLIDTETQLGRTTASIERINRLRADVREQVRLLDADILAAGVGN